MQKPLTAYVLRFMNNKSQCACAVYLRMDSAYSQTVAMTMATRARPLQLLL